MISVEFGRFMLLASDIRQFGDRARATVRLARLAVGLAWATSRVLLLGIALLLLLEAALPVAQLALAKAVIDRIVAVAQGGERLVGPGGWLPLGGWIGIAALAIGATQLLQPFNWTFQAMAGDRLTGYVMGRIIRAANSWRGVARFEDPAFADDLHRARARAAHSGLTIVREGGHVAMALFACIALALTLAGLHPLAPLLIMLVSGPQIVWQWEYMARTGDHLYIQTPEARRLGYYRETVLLPEPAKDVRLYGLTTFFGRRYDEAFRRTMETLQVLRRQLTGKTALGTALGALAVGAVYVYVVWQASRGRLTVGDVALYGGAATMLQARLLVVGRGFGQLPVEFAFLPALDRVLRAPPDLPLPACPRPPPRPIREGIVFNDVSFAYAGQSEPVLRGVSFAIRLGESLALVGHNGAGKTTIVKLLLRLYDPVAGRITLDGVDLREYDLEAVRRRMGVIFQDFVRYELTARENIGVGDLEALGADCTLLAAAGQAGVDGLVRTLPQGLDTQLGRQFGGRELSGGEWQKLALARAFVRDCDLLVLDEPTAALDVQTEYEVYLRFRELTRGRMTLLISHRFSTVRMADRILYLHDGRIAEEGCHDDLMRLDGDYARLYRLQASQYLERQQMTGEAE